MKVNFLLFTVTILLTSLAIRCGDGYRIFAIFPFNGKSHFSIMDSVVKALAEKGHQVDVVSAFPLDKPFPNYTNVIKLPKSESHEVAAYEDITDRDKDWVRVHKISLRECELLGLSELNDLIKNPPTDPPYDLVITQFYKGYQCFTAIGHLWNVPVVGVVTTFIYPQMNHFIGTPMNLGIISKNIREHKEGLTFWERVYNVLMTHHYIYKFTQSAPKQDAVIKKHLGPNVPHYKELEKSIALILANSHPTFHGIQPKVPALVEIGGIHITDDNSTMEPKFKKLLDESTHGFVYFSLGSLAQIESFPQDLIQKLFSTFKKISPVRVIMKFPNPQALSIKIPDNVFTFPWVPQRKLLQHPNIKAFVTHGGGLGSQETVYYGVPTICIPFFADQHVNCDVAQNKKFGIKFDLNENQAEYERVFHEILTNPQYKEAARKLSVLFRDRPMSPKEETVYWIEYIIRHGKDALKSPGVYMEWWQYELLDVYAFIVGSVVTTLIVIMLGTLKIMRLIFLLLRGPSKKYQAPSNKKFK